MKEREGGKCEMGTADTEMDDLLDTEQMESLGPRARASEAEGGGPASGDEDDHKIVHADIILILAEGNADEGQKRRIGVRLDDWDEAEWATHT